MRRYGFNAGLTAPGNLSKGYDSLSQDFPTIVWRLRQLGFNAVRLPFSFKHFLVLDASFNDASRRLPFVCFRQCATSCKGTLLPTCHAGLTTACA
jgi:hypothetical protein